MPIQPGLKATTEHDVTDADTASALGSGDVDVLGTPAVVALCERAAVAAVTPELEPGYTTVGTNVTIDLVAPTAVGRRVRATATLQRADGRTLHFDVEVTDASGPVARGTHTRVIVDRERFDAAARERP
jgi:predicted thioesterase